MKRRHESGASRLRCSAALLLLTVLACNERAPDLREWRVSDHDQSDSPPSAQGQVDPKAAAAAAPGLEDVTIVAWQQNCTRCHGPLGRGDGPQGPMLKATNLSEPTWQSSVTDAHIASTIKNGKGAMPGVNLPDSTIDKLVKLVRMMNAARLAPGASASGAASATPVPATSLAPAPKAAPPARASAAPSAVSTPTAPRPAASAP